MIDDLIVLLQKKIDVCEEFLDTLCNGIEPLEFIDTREKEACKVYEIKLTLTIAKNQLEKLKGKS